LLVCNIDRCVTEDGIVATDAELVMDLGLRNKHALITGASKGIGRAVSDVLADEGCDLAMVARTEDDLSNAAEDIRLRANVNVQILAADLSLSSDQQRVAATFPDVDIVVNNAGSNPAGEINQIDETTWREAWDLKVFGYINLCRTYHAIMKDRGDGVIVNVIGTGGERMNASYILGASGNIALMGLTRALGGRSPDHGVRVVGINPGMTLTERGEWILKNWTEMKYGTPDRTDDFLAEMDLPFGRMGTPNEVANAVAFIASPRASYISGTIVTVDGGAANRG
jgi:NAD(P)-dependent dehydrogenase (short-subunit alcohol dehydrogenase family)